MRLHRVSLPFLGVFLAACGHSETIGIPRFEPPQTVEFEFQRAPLKGSIHWVVELRPNGEVSEELRLFAQGRDDRGHHQLRGSVALDGRGRRSDQGLELAFDDDPTRGGKFFVLSHTLTAAESGERLEASEWVTTATNLNVLGDEGQVSGSLVLHPADTSVFVSGRDPSREVPVTLSGKVTVRSCAVIEQTALGGGLFRESVIATEDPWCAERFGTR